MTKTVQGTRLDLQLMLWFSLSLQRPSFLALHLQRMRHVLAQFKGHRFARPKQFDRAAIHRDECEVINPVVRAIAVAERLRMVSQPANIRSGIYVAAAKQPY